MPWGPIGMVRDQIEAGREFTEKILEAEKVGVATPVEVPGDAEYAQRLHEEINEPSQLAGEFGGDVAAKEGKEDEPATSSEDELWEINTNDEPMLTNEEITEIREKYEIPSFVGMKANPLGYGRSHPRRGVLGCSPRF